MRSRLSVLFAFLLAALAGAAGAADLVMVEEPGCPWCARWNREIAPAYPKTPEGRFAPLIRTDISIPEPDGTRFSARVVYTPTFILVDNGVELGRIEGYPGPDFFWGLLGKLLAEKTSFSPPGS